LVASAFALDEMKLAWESDDALVSSMVLEFFLLEYWTDNSLEMMMVVNLVY
jgi:hypothetical protein